MTALSDRLREAALDYSCFDKRLGCESADALDRAEAVCLAAEEFMSGPLYSATAGRITLNATVKQYVELQAKVKAWREGRP
jgi:hypothetical protein